MNKKNQNRMQRPKILLLGNGLNLAFAPQAFSWKKLLRSGSRNDIPEGIVVPLSLEVVLRTGNKSREMMKEKSRILYGEVSDDLAAPLKTLLEAGFDEILTTNYGYELEEAALGIPSITDYRLNRIVRSTTGRVDPKFLLHTYNEVASGGFTNRIWHIHGEARKPASMVIDHYNYGSLLNRFINFYRWRGNDYKNYHSYEEIPKESWLDAFMVGDVYILAQGFDFAEMDLWWLVNRKKNDKYAGGKIFFYEPKSDRDFDSKTELLKIYGVTPVTLGFELPEKPGHRANSEIRKRYEEEKNELFRSFYREAVRDIAKQVQKK